MNTHQLHRTTDPETSREAAGRVKEFAANHQQKILDAVQAMASATAHEIAEKTGLDHVAVNRRLSELERIGCIHCPCINGKDWTRKTPSGRSARVWVAI